MKPKIKRSHYRKNINQIYYLLKLKPSCNKIQKCAQIILLHNEFYNKKHVSSNKTLEFHEKTVIHNLIKVVE